MKSIVNDLPAGAADPQSGVKALRAACAIVMFAAPFFAAMYWAMISPQYASDAFLNPGSAIAAIAPAQRVLAFIITMVPLAPVIWLAYRLRALLSPSASRADCAAAAAAAINLLGRALVWLFFARLAFEPLITVMLSAGNAEGHRLIVLGLSPEMMVPLLSGLLLLVLHALMGASGASHVARR